MAHYSCENRSSCALWCYLAGAPCSSYPLELDFISDCYATGGNFNVASGWARFGGIQSVHHPPCDGGNKGLLGLNFTLSDKASGSLVIVLIGVSFSGCL